MRQGKTTRATLFTTTGDPVDKLFGGSSDIAPKDHFQVRGKTEKGNAISVRRILASPLSPDQQLENPMRADFNDFVAQVDATLAINAGEAPPEFPKHKTLREPANEEVRIKSGNKGIYIQCDYSQPNGGFDNILVSEHLGTTVQAKDLSKRTNQKLTEIVAKIRALREARIDTPQPKRHIKSIIERLIHSASRERNCVTPLSDAYFIQAGEFDLKKAATLITVKENPQVPGEKIWTIQHKAASKKDVGNKASTRSKCTIQFKETPTDKLFPVTYRTRKNPKERQPFDVFVSATQLAKLKTRLAKANKD